MELKAWFWMVSASLLSPCRHVLGEQAAHRRNAYVRLRQAGPLTQAACGVTRQGYSISVCCSFRFVWRSCKSILLCYGSDSHQRVHSRCDQLCDAAS